jgi:Ran GTPase-activating protein (RanGAP) involved in mRNA processing and transport
LHRTGVDDAIIEAMVGFLKNPGTKLREINLSHNGITDEGAKTFFRAVRDNPYLIKVDLSQNKLKSDGLKEISEYLSLPDNKLRELNLADNKITNEGLMKLSLFLRINDKLKKLDVSNNRFGDSGIEIFMAGLSLNKGISDLNLAGTLNLTEDGSLVTLASALANKENIRTIDLTGIPLKKRFFKDHLEPAIKRNKTLTKVISCKNPDGGNLEELLEANMIINELIQPLLEEK